MSAEDQFEYPCTRVPACFVPLCSLLSPPLPFPPASILPHECLRHGHRSLSQSFPKLLTFCVVLRRKYREVVSTQEPSTPQLSSANDPKVGAQAAEGCLPSRCLRCFVSLESWIASGCYWWCLDTGVGPKTREKLWRRMKPLLV